MPVDIYEHRTRPPVPLSLPVSYIYLPSLLHQKNLANQRSTITLEAWQTREPDASKMLFLYTLLFLPLFAATEETQSTLIQNQGMEVKNTRDQLHRMVEGIPNISDAILPTSRANIEARKKKLKLNKYILPLIVGFVLIKSILLPIALKAVAVLSGKAVVLSLMSLILAAIVGLKKVAQSPPTSNYDVISPSKYRRQDLHELPEEVAESEPYKYYRDRRRKK